MCAALSGALVPRGAGAHGLVSAGGRGQPSPCPSTAQLTFSSGCVSTHKTPSSALSLRTSALKSHMSQQSLRARKTPVWMPHSCVCMDKPTGTEGPVSPLSYHQMVAAQLNLLQTPFLSPPLNPEPQCEPGLPSRVCPAEPSPMPLLATWCSTESEGRPSAPHTGEDTQDFLERESGHQTRQKTWKNLRFTKYQIPNFFQILS